MGARIQLDFGDVQVPATLNDTDTARVFAQALPLTVQVSGTGIDFCGTLPLDLPYEPDQVGYGWTDGDVNYNPQGGWFALLFADQENSGRYGDQVNLGRVEGPLDALRTLQGSFSLRITRREGDA